MKIVLITRTNRLNKTLLEDCKNMEQIMDKTADDMEYYVKHNEFPGKDDSEPVRRRGSEDDTPRSERSSRRGRGDRF